MMNRPSWKKRDRLGERDRRRIFDVAKNSVQLLLGCTGKYAEQAVIELENDFYTQEVTRGREQRFEQAD